MRTRFPICTEPHPTNTKPDHQLDALRDLSHRIEVELEFTNGRGRQVQRRCSALRQRLVKIGLEIEAIHEAAKAEQEHA